MAPPLLRSLCDILLLLLMTTSPSSLKQSLDLGKLRDRTRICSNQGIMQRRIGDRIENGFLHARIAQPSRQTKAFNQSRDYLRQRSIATTQSAGDYRLPLPIDWRVVAQDMGKHDAGSLAVRHAGRAAQRMTHAVTAARFHARRRGKD